MLLLLAIFPIEIFAKPPIDCADFGANCHLHLELDNLNPPDVQFLWIGSSGALQMYVWGSREESFVAIFIPQEKTKLTEYHTAAPQPLLKEDM